MAHICPLLAVLILRRIAVEKVAIQAMLDVRGRCDPPVGSLGQPPVSLAEHYAVVISSANRLGNRRGIPCKRLTPGALKSYFRRAAKDIERVRLGNCRRTGSPSLC